MAWIDGVRVCDHEYPLPDVQCDNEAGYVLVYTPAKPTVRAVRNPDGEVRVVCGPCAQREQHGQGPGDEDYIVLPLAVWEGFDD